MPAKLVIDSIEVRNFLSFGDTPTTLDVANLGPTLILGENGDEGTKSSNGAGKSTLLTAFIWCLFGRTISNPSPGDKVVNWDSKANCYVKIKTADGWEITRTRKCDGHADLLITKDGQDCTLSTNQNAQQFLLDQFNLDFDVFCNSVFCGQLGKSFLEMAPAKRKEMLERILGIDKLNHYADQTKGKISTTEGKITQLRSKVEMVTRSITQYKTQVDASKERATTYEDNRQQKITQFKAEIASTAKELGAIPAIDMAKLEKDWEEIMKLTQEVEQLTGSTDKLNTQIKTLTLSTVNWTQAIELQRERRYPDVNLQELIEAHQAADAIVAQRTQLLSKKVQYETARDHCLRSAKSLQKQIDEWESKADKTCQSCKQTVDPNHVQAHLTPVKAELAQALSDAGNVEVMLKQISSQVTTLIENRPEMSIREAQRMVNGNAQIDADIAKLTGNIAQAGVTIRQLQQDLITQNSALVSAKSLLETQRPSMSLKEATAIEGRRRALQKHIDELKHAIETLVKEANPYDLMIRDLEHSISKFSDEKAVVEADIEQLNAVYKHLTYIQKCYTDRKKIKGWLLAELVPYLNDRIHHYLIGFGLDHLNITFSSTLSDETDKWDYDFCSGGERKRIDLAIMFGIYDLCTTMYGQQCNIMVLDEVDGRLDQQGVEAFADIITSDFGTASSRPDTIFVISHKSELKDVFPHHVVVKKVNGASQISIEAQ
jgi:DNA repair exonuclease SbcCD ATPase subunit